MRERKGEGEKAREEEGAVERSTFTALGQSIMSRGTGAIICTL